MGDVHPINCMVMTTTDTGTGDVVLTPETSWQTAEQAAGGRGPEHSFCYSIKHTAMVQIEHGEGHVDVTSGKLVRTKVLGGSNGTQSVDFSSGVKEVTSSVTVEYLQGIGVDRSTPLDEATAETIVAQFNALLVGLGLKKEAPLPLGAFRARSMVFDMATNHGNSMYIFFRNLDFFLQGVKIPYSAQWQVYSTTQYNDTTPPSRVFDGAYYTGDANLSTAWMPPYLTIANQRLIVVFPEETTIDDIKYNNGFNFWSDAVQRLDTGVKDLKIYKATEVYTDKAFNATIPGGVLIYDGEAQMHSAANVNDNYAFNLTV